MEAAGRPFESDMPKHKVKVVVLRVEDYIYLVPKLIAMQNQLKTKILFLSMAQS